MEQIGFGGSCHWCTEAVFQSLRGMQSVEQGWIEPAITNKYFSEAVLISFDPDIISLDTLVAVHLYTHSCTANHSFRNKYRSAIYYITEAQRMVAEEAVRRLRPDFDQPIITEVLAFGEFRLNQPSYLNYYYSDLAKPFCQQFIQPKLKVLLQHFSKSVHVKKVEETLSQISS